MVAQVEATNEVGDVWANFGSWPEAVQAWHDALDCIIGPYQVTCHPPISCLTLAYHAKTKLTKTGVKIGVYV